MTHIRTQPILFFALSIVCMCGIAMSEETKYGEIPDVQLFDCSFLDLKKGGNLDDGEGEKVFRKLGIYVTADGKYYPTVAKDTAQWRSSFQLPKDQAMIHPDDIEKPDPLNIGIKKDGKYVINGTRHADSLQDLKIILNNIPQNTEVHLYPYSVRSKDPSPLWSDFIIVIAMSIERNLDVRIRPMARTSNPTVTDGVSHALRPIQKQASLPTSKPALNSIMTKEADGNRIDRLSELVIRIYPDKDASYYYVGNVIMLGMKARVYKYTFVVKVDGEYYELGALMDLEAETNAKRHVDVEIPQYEPELERDIHDNRVADDGKDEVPVEFVIVEPVEFIDEPETEYDEDAFNNIDAGGWDTIGAIGVGGGGMAGKFGHRAGGRRHAALRGGGSKRSESAVDAALRWLARHQEDDGHFDNIKYEGQKKDHDAAQTGLSLLAFLGGGHTEKAGTFRKNVQKASKWIRDSQQANGAYSDAKAYNHAICGLAMAEASGMANVKSTVKSAQDAVDYSVNIHQIGKGEDRTGWRYTPEATTGDISCSGWFIMQLKSAKVAGLKVPHEGFQGAVAFLDSVEIQENEDDPYGGHRYCYMKPAENPTQLRPTHMRTAIGILCRQFLGWSRDELEGGVNFMIDQGGVPKWGAGGDSVDWYYWYYGTLVTFQMGGDYFKQWNGSMRDMLCDKQIKGGADDGSWDPTGKYASEGRVFSTAMGALCLEVYYRYSPLYR